VSSEPGEPLSGPHSGLRWVDAEGVPPERLALLGELTNEVRANQRATDMSDELVCQLLEINRTDARCLDILENYGPVSAGELAARSGLTTGAITAVVDRLERLGYAQRVADPNDRRRVFVEMTDKARQASFELFGPIAQGAASMSERYSDEQLRLFLDFQRAGRELQERHIEWLRERLREREGT
jgi:DNA-binding MarR family transcriptional regulator